MYVVIQIIIKITHVEMTPFNKFIPVDKDIDLWTLNVRIDYHCSISILSLCFLL